MAFYADDDEEQQEGQGQQGPVPPAVQSSTIAGQGSAPGAAPAQAKADKSGSFVGLNKYLNANKTQASKLGDQTAGVINQSADQARQGVGALNQAADQQIKGVNALDQSVLGKIQTGAETLTQQERDLAKQTASAKYTGPKSVSDFGDTYANAQKATQAATQNIQNVGTEAGRMGLISQVNAKPRTSGMNTFDNALLQAGDGRQKLATAAQTNQDVPGILDTATQGIDSKVSNAMGQTNQAQSQASKTIQDALGAWKQGFTPKVQQAQSEFAGKQNRISQDLSDDVFNQETLDMLGLGEGQKLMDFNLNDYLKTGSASDINANNVASDEDFARYSALSDLAGDKDMILDQSKKGAAVNPFNFDKERFTKDVETKDKANTDKYNNDYATSQGASVNMPELTPFMNPTDGGRHILNEMMAAKNATPAQIESQIIPQVAYKANYTGDPLVYQALATLQRQLANWKKGYSYDRTVKKG